MENLIQQNFEMKFFRQFSTGFPEEGTFGYSVGRYFLHIRGK
jgi:hypothetical protein